MPQRRVVLDISPSRLELTLVSGRTAVSTLSHPLPADLLDDWPASLNTLRPILLDWVQRHQLRAVPTTILYTSPDAHADTVAVPANIARSAALQAGRLALADAVSFPIDLNPHALTPLGRAGNFAADAQLRLLAIADTDASVSAIYTLVTGIGLRVDALIPAAAALIASTVRRAASSPTTAAPSGTTLLLHLGEHGSVLAAVCAGRLCFIRNFAVGVNSFVDALRRPIHARHGGRPPVQLDRAAARDILFAAGVPRREDTVDPRLGIDGAALLPLLQPVLQRCAVEVKQSLRFGLEEPDRAAVNLHLLGLGRAIPRLGESIAEIHGQPLTFAPDTDSEPRATAGCAAAAYLNAGSLNLALLPREVESGRTARSITRALWAGVGAAALLVTADGALTHLALRDESRTPINQAAVSDDPALRLYNEAIAARSGVAAARARLESALGGATDWSAVLAMLSTLTPAEIRLRTIDLLDEPGDGPVCRIRAVATPPEGAIPAVIIKQYLDAVGATPLVADVRLGASGRAVVDGATVHEFELFCDLVPLPAPSTAPRLAAAPSEEPGP